MGWTCAVVVKGECDELYTIDYSFRFYLDFALCNPANVKFKRKLVFCQNGNICSFVEMKYSNCNHRSTQTQGKLIVRFKKTTRNIVKILLEILDEFITGKVSLKIPGHQSFSMTFVFFLDSACDNSVSIET